MDKKEIEDKARHGRPWFSPLRWFGEGFTSVDVYDCKYPFSNGLLAQVADQLWSRSRDLPENHCPKGK